MRHLTESRRLRAIAERAFHERQAEDAWRAKLDAAIVCGVALAFLAIAWAAIN